MWDQKGLFSIQSTAKIARNTVYFAGFDSDASGGTTRKSPFRENRIGDFL